MWRPPFTILRKAILSSNGCNKFFHASRGPSKSRPMKNMKIALIGVGTGLAIGVGYGGYTHYLVNSNKTFKPVVYEDYAFLKEPPEYKPHYKIINERDTSNLKLVLFQYRTCPFCCKVRAYLDARGISYEVVEVDAVLRQAIKWSGYKKVPILLAKVDGGYQQLLDSTAIISVLETYLRDKTAHLQDIVKFYPSSRYKDENGKEVSEISNKYFIMHQDAPMLSQTDRKQENEEREWRQWADRVLVHTLSPNVYRTPSEALETFQWFEEVGGWRKNFPAWECLLMVYGGAAAMWLIAKRLKTRHNIDDARSALYNAANKWMSAIKKKGTPFLGGDQPNLADISVYGILSSIEGCRAFQEMRNNTSIGKWYDDVKQRLESQRGKIMSVQAYA